MDRLDLSEDHVEEVLLAVERSRRTEKRAAKRSWAEALDLKRQLRKERNFTGGQDDDVHRDRPNGGSTGDGKCRRRKMPIDQLKKISR